ncbi:DNA replication protein [Starmerella bacillaris]|mgnify:CR=1 FL=1|uniref:DNA replication complex GINS protein PSF2 n=1 Tax=Starmerella bacillaris TaxID=1247836 RepID=A0AAV5RP04_STABA|nr:DNA replication protein [Starmerella bacillaris]
MSLDASQFEAFSASELAFLAEDELITILPRQNLSRMDFKGWVQPALRALRRSEVPLWLAVILKRQDRCTIIYPNWLDATYLKTVLEAEGRDSASFAALPYMWQELSDTILAEAAEDCQGSVAEIMRTLQELKELRLNKLRQGVLVNNDSHLRMDGIGSAELNLVKPILSKTMRTLQTVKDAQEVETV